MQKYWVTVDDVGTTRWYKDAKRTILHRVGGPATEWADGNMHWHLNGKRHRTDGPAIQWPSGDKSWWLNGLLHRTDGAAIELVNGIKKWYLDGEQLTEQQHAHRVNPVQEMTVADIEKLLGKRIKIIK